MPVASSLTNVAEWWLERTKRRGIVRDELGRVEAVGYPKVRAEGAILAA